jgi:hypothetical protein
VAHSQRRSRGARATLRPDAGQRALLTHPGLIGEPACSSGSLKGTADAPTTVGTTACAVAPNA